MESAKGDWVELWFRSSNNSSGSRLEPIGAICPLQFCLVEIRSSHLFQRSSCLFFLNFQLLCNLKTAKVCEKGCGVAPSEAGPGGERPAPAPGPRRGGGGPRTRGQLEGGLSEEEGRAGRA